MARKRKVAIVAGKVLQGYISGLMMEMSSKGRRRKNQNRANAHVNNQKEKMKMKKFEVSTLALFGTSVAIVAIFNAVLIGSPAMALTGILAACACGAAEQIREAL